MSSSVKPPDPSCQVAAYPDPIEGIIPFGTLTIFAGAPGVGKTAMLAEWCRRWRDGQTICGKATHAPTGFYYIAADRQWKSHQLWFDAAGFGDIPHYSIADDPTFDLTRLKSPQHAHDCLLRALDKLKPQPGGHVIVDPVSPLFIGGDPNRARDVAASLLQQSRICQTHLVNLTCSAHFGKQKSDPREQYTRPQDRIAGSGAFAGFSDTQIYLIDPVPPDQPYHILGWTPRHAKPEEFHYTRNDQGLFVPYGLYEELDRLEAVLLAIPDTPTTTPMIIQLITATTGYSSAQAERYLSSLVKQGRVTKIRRGLYKRATPN